MELPHLGAVEGDLSHPTPPQVDLSQLGAVEGDLFAVRDLYAGGRLLSGAPGEWPGVGSEQ